MQEKQRFIRVRGRIVPIKAKKEINVAREITAKKNRSSLGVLSAATAGYFGGLYASGALYKKAAELDLAGKIKLSSGVSRLAKLGKFGTMFAAGHFTASAISSIDKRTSDEKARALNIGSNAKTSLGVATAFAAAYASYRVGKRFEVAGKMGKNLFKLKDLKSLRSVKDI